MRLSPTLIVLALATQASAGTNFVILTPQLSGYTSMRVNDVSGDGTIAVGQISANVPLHAARWTAANAVTDMGLLAGRPYAQLTHCSTNGSIACGDALDGNFKPLATRWTSPTAKTSLPVMTGGTFCYTSGISSDGSVIAGWGDIAGGKQRMWRWTSATGTVTIPLPAGITDGYSANANLQATRNLSGNGRYVIGTTNNTTPAIGFIYDATTGVSTDIGRPQPNHDVFPTSISNDGSVICGYCYYNYGDGVNGEVGFRWTSASGFQLIFPLSGHENEIVLARFMSGDGNTILGTSSGTNFVWTAANGIESFDDYLAVRGVDTQGMTEFEFSGISDNGAVLTGMGVTSTGDFRGWILNVPHCPGDFNGDGFVDIFDFNAYISCFEDGSCPGGTSADFDGDGFVDIFDFNAFVTAFQAGC